MTDNLQQIKDVDIRRMIELETSQSFRTDAFLPECPFCQSGRGATGTPAFNVGKGKNFFKCFSCDAKGSTIDFIAKHHRISDGEAMKYISEKYLHIVWDRTKEENAPKQPVDLTKRIAKIKSNKRDKSTQYLISRGIDIKALPYGAYYEGSEYEGIPASVIFLDNSETLINQRYIKEFEYNGKRMKVRNTGEIANKLYTRTYRKEAKSVFIHEGCINILSMPTYSCIGLFASTNKISNPSVLRSYLEGKKVVLCGDNDSKKAQAGQKFNEYYGNFILQHINTLGIYVLNLPEDTDVNDLLKQGKLETFLKDKNSYSSFVSTGVVEKKEIEVKPQTTRQFRITDDKQKQIITERPEFFNISMNTDIVEGQHIDIMFFNNISKSYLKHCTALVVYKELKLLANMPDAYITNTFGIDAQAGREKLSAIIKNAKYNPEKDNLGYYIVSKTSKTS